MISIKPSKNLEKLSSYISAKINRLNKKVYGKKSYVTNLDIWNPDSPIPHCIINRFCNTLKHNNIKSKKIPEFRKTITEQMTERPGIKVLCLKRVCKTPMYRIIQ